MKLEKIKINVKGRRYCSVKCAEKNGEHQRDILIAVENAILEKYWNGDD